jgi:3-hydroxyisobutyrate dehydrogenase-like beta-hydroxyacid dehydrogenase
MARAPLTVGVVGVGNLGDGIACALLRAGHPVRFLDPRPDAGGGILELGGRRADTLAGLAADVDVVLAVVVNDEQVGEVVSGIADAARPGLTLVIHSTVAPATAQAAAERLEPLGVVVLDAPVSGGPDAAREARLTIMVGAAEEAFQRCRPLLEAIGDDIFHLGPVGAGSAAKLANQLMLYGNWLFAGQALELAGACGIDEATMLRVARSGTADSWGLRNFERLGAHFEELIGKDVRLCLQTADRLGARCDAARRIGPLVGADDPVG